MRAYGEIGAHPLPDYVGLVPGRIEVLALPVLELGARQGMSEGAVKVSVHRLRRRFGELVRSQIERTVASPDEIDDEIRQLFGALG